MTPEIIKKKMKKIFSFKKFDNVVAYILDIEHSDFRILYELEVDGSVYLGLYYKDKWFNCIDERIFEKGETIPDRIVDLYANISVFKYDYALDEPTKISKVFSNFSEWCNKELLNQNKF